MFVSGVCLFSLFVLLDLGTWVLFSLCLGFSCVCMLGLFACLDVGLYVSAGVFICRRLAVN